MSPKRFSHEVVVVGGASLGSIQKLSRVAWQDKRIDKYKDSTAPDFLFPNQTGEQRALESRRSASPRHRTSAVLDNFIFNQTILHGSSNINYVYH